MAELSEVWTLLNEASFHEKATAAALSLARDVNNEEVETENHANRLKWAKAVLANPVGMGTVCKNAVLSRWGDEKTVEQLNALTDADIKAAISVNINVLADGT